MSRAFDHLVLAVNDLDKAARFYQAIGFTLTPPAQHPFGTGNRLAQLQGCFLEVLSVTEPENVPEAEPGSFSFGAYNRDFLARRQGMSMMVLQTTTAAADRDDFKAAGLDTYKMFDFSRDAALPDGSTATVGFTLAFATVPELPDAVAFTCQQWRPDLFWKPEYQNHANGAVTISEMFMVADDGAAPAKLLNGLDLDPIGGKTSVITPEAFAARFAGAEIASSYAGFRVAVSDMEAARTCLEENRVAYEETAGTIWITPAAGFGCVIEFAPHRGDG